MESLLKQRARALKILIKLKKAYPKANIALKFKTPMQLLTAVILSAQATDNHVNKVTEGLFKKYKTVNDFASANLRTFTKEVSSINFYRNKAKFITSSARKIRNEYAGKIPDSIDELIKLPGVARKTANIVQYQLYKKAEGVSVDTHVKRVSNNLKLTAHRDPKKIEQDLMKLYPQKEWGTLGYYFQAYGRTVMPARRMRDVGGRAKGKPLLKDPLKGLY